ncbi:hypothetical protein [Photobacterium galatheae]|uniref:Uncharacterized protein n=1 Tax=Photobacterium galatheae TaxID=1654360 RepID=A0A066RRI2_9GAMM|nr:hypothetical protein [Photobacterium galatheae]KDM90282.1 hypothetical protein EA58_18000 [Photobacterium galatheae]MCM0151717.1 hypothetical protein [Photobacterium galatheae]
MNNQINANDIALLADGIEYDFSLLRTKGARAFMLALEQNIEKYHEEIGPLENAAYLKNYFAKAMRSAKKPDGSKKTNFGWTEAFGKVILAIRKVYGVEVTFTLK